MNALQSRMMKELEMIEKDPPPGISCWPVDDCINELEASLSYL